MCMPKTKGKRIINLEITTAVVSEGLGSLLSVENPDVVFASRTIPKHKF